MARKDRDFIPFTKTIVFPANARGDALKQEIRITVLGDRLAEKDEMFGLWLDVLKSKDKVDISVDRIFGPFVISTPAAIKDGELAALWVTIADDDAAPVLEAIEGVTVTAGQEVDITASATDADGDTISYAWSRKAGETTPALPQGTALNQAQLTFTPTAAGVLHHDGDGGRRLRQHRQQDRGDHGQQPAGEPAQPAHRAGGATRNGEVTLSWDDPSDTSITATSSGRRTRPRAGGVDPDSGLRRCHRPPHGDGVVDQRHGLHLPDPRSQRRRGW